MAGGALQQSGKLAWSVRYGQDVLVLAPQDGLAVTYAQDADKGGASRHFPTRQALLRAIMKGLLVRLADQADELAAREDPAAGLFTFFASLVGQAAEKKTVVGLLGHAATTCALTR